MAKKKDEAATLRFGGQTIKLSKSADTAAVRYNPGGAPAAKRGAQKPADGSGVELEGFRLVKGRDIDAKLDALREQANVAAGTHVYHIGDERAPFVATGKIYLEFEAGASADEARALIEKLHLRIIETEGDHIYRVAVTSLSPNPVKCCAELQRSPLVEVAEPELATFPSTFDFSMPSGAFVKTQWHLKNTGEAIPVIEEPGAVWGKRHFKKGADARVADAWAALQSTGSSKIRIAVIDTGFDTGHPAFAGKVIAPYNAADDSTDVTPVIWSASGEAFVASHGTSCAAVAAGNVPEEGVFGAAPMAKIMPIKLNILSDSAIIRAFRHAMNNGADIISCSLGWPTPMPLSTDVANFLRRVAREGRGGKGIAMFFAAGNANPASNNVPREVSDFAAHPDGICVTASNSLDEPSDYSFFGKNAWVCAPTNGNDGVGITTAHAEWDGSQVVHTYTSGFGGTSSAAPLTAGCGALLLSANPSLSAAQIKEILKKTTEKIAVSGGYDANGHSRFTGFGRLNALSAVKLAAPATGGQTVPAPTPTPVPPATARQKGRVVSKFLNVRTGPSTSYAKVDQLKQGDSVELFEKVDAWYRIGEGRWVMGDYLRVEAARRQGKVISADPLNVRKGPDVSFSKVGTLKPGAAVTVFETSVNGWLRVGDGQWVSGRFIQLS